LPLELLVKVATKGAVPEVGLALKFAVGAVVEASAVVAEAGGGDVPGTQ